MCTTLDLIKYSKGIEEILFSDDLPSRGSGRVPNQSHCLAPQANKVGVARQTPLISVHVKNMVKLHNQRVQNHTQQYIELGMHTSRTKTRL